MKQPDPSLKNWTATFLINRLAQGWSPKRSGVLREFLRRWEHNLDTRAEITELGVNTLVFLQDLTDVHLRGMSDIPCLVITGSSINQTGHDQLKKILAPARLPFVLTLSDECYQHALQILPNDRCLLLSRNQIVQILCNDEPGLILKQLLWQQIPKSRLSPYNLLQPAEGPMFFGRRAEVGRLIDEDETSFAIAGPGRIGKTSLLNRYRHEMLRRRVPRLSQCVLINFFDCHDTTSDGIARFLAMKLVSSSRSYRMTTDGLVNFLNYLSREKGPLDLLLDEVDLVCQSHAFRALGAAARMGFCRLVLSGKGVVLNTMLKHDNPLECRLDLIQLGPLDHSSARELLLKPFADLNFQFVDPEKTVDQVLRFTGRLPHLIQLFCMRLANLTIEAGLHKISREEIETVKRDFVVAQYFVKPILDIEDPEARFIGLLLLTLGDEKLSVTEIQTIAQGAGLGLSIGRVFDICNVLLINNVLSWTDNSFQIATEGLGFYAHKMDFLNHALNEAYQALKN